jgi:anthranilate synthase component 2
VSAKILVFDNYDSFTYNLVHLVEKILHTKVTVKLNDQLALEEVKDFDKIILSPGPGIPSEAGLLIPLINAYAATKSFLGVCLGHQAIGEAFGAKLVNLDTVFHGVSTPIRILDQENILFQQLDKTQLVGRYHSWVIDGDSLPRDFQVTAIDDNCNIMAMQHKSYDLQSVQFHPESVLTPNGETMLRNWLNA